MKRRTIEKAVGDERLSLHAGEGYFYFSFEAEGYYNTETVYTYRLHDLSLERWVEEAKSFIAACEEEMKHRSAPRDPRTPIRFVRRDH